MADGSTAEDERPENRFDWRNPDYPAVLQARLERLKWIRSNPKNLPAIRAYYRTHIDDWVNDWGITYDPRNISKGLPADVPLILFQKQREWLRWTFENWIGRRYGGTEKSRDVGASWLLIAFSVGIATPYESAAIGWGSFKEEKVDKRGDMGSLFEKGRYYVENLPIEFRAGFDRSTCSSERNLRFPATKGAIVGEVGDNIGRGGRTSVYFVDEAAYLEHDNIVDMALSKNTQCRQDVSSVRGMTNSFAQRMHDGHSRRFTFHWRDNPLFSQVEYDEFLRQWGPVITAQELDIDYQASVEGVIIPQAWIQASIDAHKKLGVEPSGIRRGALDVADQGRDVNAFAARHGVLVTYCASWSGKESDLFATTEKAFMICDELRLDGFDADADGLGAGIRGDATRIRARRQQQRIKDLRVGEFRGSAGVIDPTRKVPGTDRTNLDMFQNLKAQSWWALMRRFQETHRAVTGQPYDADGIISLSSDIKELSKLCIELSQPQWKLSANGKLMVDKIPEGQKSPNLADAIMIAFAYRRGPMRIADSILNEPAMID